MWFSAITKVQYSVGVQIADIQAILEIKRIVPSMDRWEGYSRRKGQQNHYRL